MSSTPKRPIQIHQCIKQTTVHNIIQISGGELQDNSKSDKYQMCECGVNIYNEFYSQRIRFCLIH